MNRPIMYNKSGAETLAEAAYTLYNELQKKFGAERAWEFVLAFYQQGGKNDG